MTELMTKAEGIKALTKYTPEGMSPKVFLTMLVNTFGVNPTTKKMWPIEVYVMMGYTCTRLQLDPFAKQVYFLPFWDGKTKEYKIATVVGIDGMRLIAQRSGMYAGQDDIEYDTEDGEHPNRATVTVYKLNKKTGERMPTVATARWGEYVKKNFKTGEVTGQWKDRPWLMLGKAAEGLALRKAFPQELSGVYSEEEMERERDDRAEVLAQLPSKNATKPEQKVSTDGEQTANKAPSSAPAAQGANEGNQEPELPTIQIEESELSTAQAEAAGKQASLLKAKKPKKATAPVETPAEDPNIVHTPDGDVDIRDIPL